MEDEATFTICFTIFESVSPSAAVSCSLTILENSLGIVSILVTIVDVVSTSEASSGLKARTYKVITKPVSDDPAGRVVPAYVPSDLG